MPLHTISSLFDKYKSLTPPDYSVRTAACECISKVVGIKLSEKDISVERGVLIVKASPVIRNEIFIRKTHVLICLKEKCESETPSDIK